MADNEELQNMLNEIGGDKDPLPSGQAIDITKIEPPLAEEPMVPAPAPPPTPTLPVVPPVDPNQIDAAKLLKQYLAVYEKFLTNYDADRDQIEKTIKHLEDIVLNVGGAQRVHVEMLVAALRVKTETNGNVVKALDSIAKILAAAKGTQVLINNNSTNTQVDLAKILAQPLYPDEQR